MERAKYAMDQVVWIKSQNPHIEKLFRYTVKGIRFKKGGWSYRLGYDGSDHFVEAKQDAILKCELILYNKRIMCGDAVIVYNAFGVKDGLIGTVKAQRPNLFYGGVSCFVDFPVGLKGHKGNWGLDIIDTATGFWIPADCLNKISL